MGVGAPLHTHSIRVESRPGYRRVMEEIGESIAALRIRRGMTQEGLAEAAGVSVSTLSKLEQGSRQDPSMATLRKIAAGLGVTTGELFTPSPTFSTARLDAGERSDLHALRQVLQPARSVDGSAVWEPADGVVPSLAEIRESTREANQMYQRNQYVTAFQLLPGLISDARVAAEELTGEDQVGALVQLSHAYRLAGSLLTHLRSDDLAYSAYGMAARAGQDAGQDVLTASAVIGETWLLIRQGRFQDVERVAVASADAIEPKFSRASRAELASWGWLMLRAAAAAVRNNRAEAATDMLLSAAAAAARIGRDQIDYHEYWSTLGPAVVAMKRVETALISGDVATAAEVAKTIPPGKVTSNNWNRHQLDLVAISLERRQWERALKRLAAVRRGAPSWLRYQRYAAQLTERLLTNVRRKPPELREVAQFLRVGH